MRYLGEYSYEEVCRAVDVYACTETSGFAPTIGQLINSMRKTDEYSILTATAAWAMVREAISRAYGDRLLEEFEKLPQAAQRAIGNPKQLEWWNLDPEFNENVIMSQFIKSYNIEVNRERERAKMPANVRALIDQKNADNEAYLIECKERVRPVPQLPMMEDVEEETCVPMPEHLRAKVEKWRRGL